MISETYGVSEESLRLARMRADSLPPADGLTFRRVPIEAFSIEQVRKMLALSQRQLEQERSDHMRSLRVLSGCSDNEDK